MLVIQPFSPEANYEMAMVYHETDKTEKALYQMNRVLRIWENADPDFEPAIKARATLGEWEQ